MSITQDGSQNLPRWNPDFGHGTEHLGSFEPVSLTVDPDYRQQAPPQESLQFHTNMHGGTFTDPETGESFHIRLNAPPEPQGIQSWHHGPMDVDWSAFGYSHPNFYHAKQETAPIQQYDVELPQHLLDASGVTDARKELDSRLMYSQGPPQIKASFNGIREDMGRSAGWEGFQNMNRYAPPTPMTGKEWVDMGPRDQFIAPVGGQRVHALPVEGRQTVTPGLPETISQIPFAGHRGANHLNPLRERVEQSFSENSNNNPTIRPQQDDTAIYSLHRGRVEAPILTRVSLMKFSSNLASSDTAGSTRLHPFRSSSLAQTFDGSFKQSLGDLFVVQDSHQTSSSAPASSTFTSMADINPIEGMDKMVPSSAVRHAVTGPRAGWSQAPPDVSREPTEKDQYRIVSTAAIRTVPQMNNTTQQAPAFVPDAEETVDLYKVYRPRTVAQMNGNTQQAGVFVSDITEDVDLYKVYKNRTVAQMNNATPQAATFQPDIEQGLRMSKTFTPRSNPQMNGVTPQAETFQPDIDQGLRLSKTFKPRSNPQMNGVTPQAEPFQSDIAVQWNKPGSVNIQDRVAHGTSVVRGMDPDDDRISFPVHLPVVDVDSPAVQTAVVAPHGVFNGQLKSRNDPRITTRALTWKDNYNVRDNRNMTTSFTMVNDQTPHPSFDTHQYQLSGPHPRKAYLFPPLN